MTPEQLIEMARECGIQFFHLNDIAIISLDDLAKFAQLVAAHEAEEIIKLSESDYIGSLSDAIRARSSSPDWPEDNGLHPQRGLAQQPKPD